MTRFGPKIEFIISRTTSGFVAIVAVRYSTESTSTQDIALASRNRQLYN